MNIVIENPSELDIPELERICLLTADSGKDGTHLYSDKALVGQIYLTPYVLFDPSCCFVAKLDGKIVGYIVGCYDSKAFYKYLNNEFLPSIRNKFTTAITQSDKNIVSMIQNGVEAEFYPQAQAHLHIDILPEGQHMGLGRKLIDTFTQNLKNHQINSVYLGVGAKNTNAQAFYKKMGFLTFIEKAWGLVLIKNI